MHDGQLSGEEVGEESKSVEDASEMRRTDKTIELCGGTDEHSHS